MNHTAYPMLIERIDPKAPHGPALRSVVDRMFQFGHKLDDIQEKAAKDPRLTAVGRREQVAEAAKGMIREVLDAARPQRGAMAQVVGQKMHMKPKPVSTDDARGELRRAEIRAFIRSQPTAQRIVTAMELVDDDEALSAILDAPAQLSGLPPAHFAEIRDTYVQKRFGEQIAKLNIIEEHCASAGAAVTMCMDTLQRASGLPEIQFRDLVEKTQAEIDAR